ncbi:hypothetical protein BSL78_22119 [Apostichopus japonicus]|uniref:Uncharacterized protein n=1 Tax=Stichopus japonicus TaxID=307972 RepID=A0A2G8JZ48_STIJA|nr:hypothetical protein BSL78_22119 [Apostichopus japonicus]
MRNNYDTLARTSFTDDIHASPQALAMPRQPSPTHVAPNFLNELSDALVKPRSPNRYNTPPPPQQSPQAPHTDPGRPPVMPKPPTKSKPTVGQPPHSSPKRSPHPHMGVPGCMALHPRTVLPTVVYFNILREWPPTKKSQNPHAGPHRQSLPSGMPPAGQTRGPFSFITQ